MGPKKQQSKSERFAKSAKGAVGLDAKFISFSNVVKTEEDSVVLGPSPVYTGADPDLMLISKKLSKKNSSTRNKALSELKVIVEERIEIISPEFIAFLVFIYERLLLDNDRYVREEINSIYASLLKIDRRQFKSYISNIIGPMWLVSCDPVGDVSSSAERVFESTFPNPDKRIESLSLHSSTLIQYLATNIKTTPETLSDMSNTSVEEADERYERVVASALSSLAKLLILLPLETLEQQSLLGKLLSKQILPFIQSPRFQFRRGTFQILINLLEHKPSIISSSAFVEQLITNLMTSLSTERHTGMIPLLLQAVIGCFTAFPSTLNTSLVDLSTYLFPQIQEILLNFPDLCLPALLPLLSTIPLNELVKNKLAFTNVLNSLKSLTGSFKNPSEPWMTLAEISTFLVIRLLKLYENSGMNESTVALIKELFDELITAFVRLLCQNQSSLVIPLLSHLHKQTFISKTHNSLNFNWDETFAKTIQQTLLDFVGQGLKGQFLSFQESIIFLLSKISQIDHSNFNSVTQPNLGGFATLHAIFHLADTHCRVLIPLLNENSFEALEVFLLWSSTGLKIGNIIVDLSQTYPHLISDTLGDVHSFINLNALHLSLQSFNKISHTSSEYDSQLKYSLVVFHELHQFLLKIMYLPDLSFAQKMLSNVLSLVNENHSLLWFLLLEKDGVISSCKNLSLIQDPIPSIAWFKFCLKMCEENQTKTLGIALVQYCQQKGFFSADGGNDGNDNDENKLTASTYHIWIELTEYYQQLSSQNLPPLTEKVISSFQRAFFLDHSPSNCRVISQEFQIISCWNDLQNLNLVDSHATTFAHAITSSLKTILFQLIDSTALSSSPSDVAHPDNSFSHFLNLLTLVENGYFKSVDKILIFNEIGIFDEALWDQLHLLAKQMSQVERKIETNGIILTLNMLNSVGSEMDVDPFISFQILWTLSLFQMTSLSSHPDLSRAISLSRTLLLKNNSSIFCTKLAEKTFSLLKSCENQAEMETLLATFSWVVEFKSQREIKERNTDFLELPTISKGMKAYYLRKILLVDSELSYFISPVELTVLEIDKRVGEMPFYTLGYPDGQEIQTERSRVVFPAKSPTFMNSSDLVNELIENNTSKSSILVDRIETFLSTLIKCDANSTQDLLASLHLTICILKNIGSFHFESNEYSSHLIGCARYAIIHLLNCHPIGAISLVHCGLELLHALSQTRMGCGSGMWLQALILPILSQIFQAIKTTKLILTQQEREVYLTKLLTPISVLLENHPSNLLMESASLILDFTLSDIGLDSYFPLRSIAITTAHQIWEFISSYSPESKVEKAWESKIFSICVMDILSCSSSATSASSSASSSLTREMTTMESTVLAVEQAFKVYQSNEILSLMNDLFEKATEFQLWEYISHNCHSFRSRWIIFKVLDVWSTRQLLFSELEFDASQDENKSGRIFLEKALDRYLDSFENTVSRWEQHGHKNEISLDSLYWCLCGHSDHTFCSNQNPFSQHIDFFGILFQWLILLQKIDCYCSAAPWSHRALIGSYLGKSSFFQLLIQEQVAILTTIQSREFPTIKELFQFIYNSSNSSLPSQEDQIRILLFSLSRTICVLPAASRAYYLGACSRSQCLALERFVENFINERIVKREVTTIELAQSEALNIRCSVSTGEITTTYTADEVSIEMTIKLPKLYPLKNVEVECLRRMGINEGRWRRWTLQIIQLLSQHDGSVLDAILFWKKNVDKEFEGVEPCPICYSVLDPKSLALPTLQCPTCRNKFHPPCLYKWFNTSGKSKCVLCQQPFFN